MKIKIEEKDIDAFKRQVQNQLISIVDEIIYSNLFLRKEIRKKILELNKEEIDKVNKELEKAYLLSKRRRKNK